MEYVCYGSTQRHTKSFKKVERSVIIKILKKLSLSDYGEARVKNMVTDILFVLYIFI